MYRGHRITVVVPAHNEARLLPRTLRTLPEYVDEVIVVDDASVDGTAERAAESGVSRARVLRHARNTGVGGAIVTGYRDALDRGVDIAVVVGADAQMDPTEMHRLLDPVVEGRADYAKGDRLGHPALWRRMPWVRLLGNLVLGRLTSWATGVSVRDAQCGYTAITARALRALRLADLYPRYGFPNDLLAQLAAVRARVVDCPVSPIYGEERSDLRVHRVVLPILGILVRAVWARWLRAVRPPRRSVRTPLQTAD
jgi:glycosyltransferase involved in cell wall biosynthesis